MQLFINPYRYGFNGKEKDDEVVGSGNSYDYGDRMYDARLGRMRSIDKYANKYPFLSPYSYAANNPLSIIDINGDSLYILVSVKGYDHGDDMFAGAVQTRKYDIEHSPNFDPKRDKVAVLQVQDLADIEKKVESTIAENKGTYGNTVEFGVWSHSGLAGPTGSALTSENALDKKQMTAAGWAKIDFNWSKGGNDRAGFYGCRSGLVTPDQPKSFATEISGLSNFKDVTVGGQSNYSFPSPYSNVRFPTLDQVAGSYLPIEYRPANQNALPYLRKTYMVAGEKGGLNTEKSFFSPTPASKMNYSKNGTPTGSGYQPGDKKN